MEEQIKAKLEELRGGLQADGGDLELVKIDGKVYGCESWKIKKAEELMLLNCGVGEDS